VYSRVITGELLELGPNKPLAQGTTLGYVITGYLNKETSSDTEPTKDSKRQNEISLDEERSHLTNLALMDHKLRTSDTDSSDRGSTAIHSSSLQLTELYNTKEKQIDTEPTSHQLKTNKKPDFCSTFLNLTKKYLSVVAESPHTTDVPNNQVLRGHNFSPHGNVNFIAMGSVKQNQEGMSDLNHKHEPPQLKEGGSFLRSMIR